MPVVKKILETALYVNDVALSQEFYERALGFKPIFSEGNRLHALSAGESGQVLLLFTKGGSVEATETEGGTIPPHDGDGNLHLAFAIDHADLESWKAKLADSGVLIESVVTAQFGGISLYFRDPDNHLVELATPGIWPGY